MPTAWLRRAVLIALSPILLPVSAAGQASQDSIRYDSTEVMIGKEESR